MHRIRQTVRRRNVFHWLDSFLNASIARRLDDFPPVDHYVPSERPRAAVSIRAPAAGGLGEADPHRRPMSREGGLAPPAARGADHTILPSGV
jgi:hypothetical protein